MTWQQQYNFDYQYLTDTGPIAALTWTGNLWYCQAIGSRGEVSASKITLADAQKWAEEVINAV